MAYILDSYWMQRNWMLCKPQCQRISSFSRKLQSGLLLINQIARKQFKNSAILTHPHLISSAASAQSSSSMKWTCILLDNGRTIICPNFAHCWTIFPHCFMASIHWNSTKVSSQWWSSISARNCRMSKCWHSIFYLIQRQFKRLSISAWTGWFRKSGTAPSHDFLRFTFGRKICSNSAWLFDRLFHIIETNKKLKYFLF